MSPERGHIDHPNVAHIDWLNQTEIDRARSLHSIPRYHTVEQMTHRTSVLIHSLRVMAHTSFASQVLEERGIGIDREKVIFLADHHDDTEIITGDIPTPQKRNATDEERAQMEEEDRQASIKVDHLVQKPLFIGNFPKEYEEYRRQDTLEAKLVNYLDKWDAVHECVHEIVTGDNKDGFKNILEAYRNQMKGLNEENKEWLGVVEVLFGDDFSEFPEAESLVPKDVEELDYSSFSKFTISLLDGNPNSYNWWLKFNKSVFGLEYLDAVFPGWMDKFPQEVLSDIERVKRKEPLKRLPSGLWVPSSQRSFDRLTFGEEMEIDILSSRLSVMTMVL